MLAIKVPKDAEKVLLHPPKAVPNFGGRGKASSKSPSGKKEDSEAVETDQNNVLEDEPLVTADGEADKGAPASSIPESGTDGLPELEDEE